MNPFDLRQNLLSKIENDKLTLLLPSIIKVTDIETCLGYALKLYVKNYFDSVSIPK